ncbi:hypothetical protein LINPERHAP1_LOCUS24405, partial [Linum perenne]
SCFELDHNVKFKYAGFRKALTGGKKIVVELPDEGILPVGHLLSFMGQHCGECGRNWSFYHVSAVDWKKQDKRLKDIAWRNLALPIYHIEPRDLEPFRRVCEMKVGQSWSKSRLRLWEKLVKEARATGKDEDWIKSSNPRGITLNDWTIYMSYVYGEEFQKKSTRGKRARSIQETNHHGGSRPWARYIEEQISKTGVKPSRGQLYIKFYKLDRGDEKDRKLADLIQELEANGAPIAWGPHDSLAQALNKDEPRGRLRAGGVGKNKTLVYGRMRGRSESSPSSAA